MASQTDFFVVSPEEAVELSRELRVVWDAMFGGDKPGELASDLERLGSWYGPQAQSARIARRLGDMPSMNVRERSLRVFDPPLLLGTPQRAVLTPEGRVALEDLYAAGHEQHVTLHVQDSYTLTDLYRQWSYTATVAALDLRGGRAGQTRPPAVGLALLLLVLGAVGRSRALTVNTAMAAERDAALREVFGPFARAVSRSTRTLNDPMWAWPASHAENRFQAVLRERGPDKLQHFWIDEDGWKKTMEEVAAELMRRPKVKNVSSAMAAVEALVAALDERIATLGNDLLLPGAPANREAALDALREACVRAARS